MENTKFLKIVIIALLLLNTATLAFMWFSGHKGPPPPGRAGHDPGQYIVHELNFDEQQVQAFDKLKREHHEAHVALQQQMADDRHTLFSLIQSNDTAKAQDVMQQIAARQMEIERITYQHFQQVRALCNAEQQKHFDEIISHVLDMILGPPPGPPGGGPPPR